MQQLTGAGRNIDLAQAFLLHRCTRRREDFGLDCKQLADVNGRSSVNSSQACSFRVLRGNNLANLMLTGFDSAPHLADGLLSTLGDGRTQLTPHNAV